MSLSRRNDVATSFDVMVTLLFRHVSAGLWVLLKSILQGLVLYIIHMRPEMILVITAHAYVLAPNGARSSADTVLTTMFDMYSSSILRQSWLCSWLCLLSVIIWRHLEWLTRFFEISRYLNWVKFTESIDAARDSYRIGLLGHVNRGIHSKFPRRVWEMP